MEAALRKLSLFRALPRKTIKRLGEAAALRRFRKGEVLFEEGRPAEFVWVLQRGWIYLMRRTPAGVPVTIFTVTPEEVLCGFSAVTGGGTYYASAVAATDTTAMRLPHAAFARLLRSRAGFAERVLTIYHTRMRHMAQAITLAQAPVEQRLAYTLLRLRASFGRTIPVTHHELSRMAGIRWETSIRTISTFKRKRWLATSRGQMVVLRPDQLNAVLKST